MVYCRSGPGSVSVRASSGASERDIMPWSQSSEMVGSSQERPDYGARHSTADLIDVIASYKSSSDVSLKPLR